MGRGKSPPLRAGIRILLRPEVEAEITRAFRWYKRRSPQAGAAFLVAVDGRIRAIKENPLRFPIMYGRARRVLLPHFPYALYFGMARGVAIVVACCHTRRKPERWQARVRKYLPPL